MLIRRKDLRIGFVVGAGVFVAVVGYALVAGFGGEETTADAGPDALGDPLALMNGSTETTTADTAPPASHVSSYADDATDEQWSGGSSTYTAANLNSEPAAADVWDESFQVTVTRTPDAYELDTTAADIGGLEDLPGGASPKAVPAQVQVWQDALAQQRSAEQSAPETAPAQVGVTREHVIAAGENYTTIARDYYGNANLYHLLQKANPDIDPRKLRPGMTVVVPAYTGSNPAPRVEKTVEARVAAPGEYVVQKDDSLYKIAERELGRAALWESLYGLNRDVIGSDPTRLKVGMVLKLPQ